jgi:hypothetical protein
MNIHVLLHQAYCNDIEVGDNFEDFHVRSYLQVICIIGEKNERDAFASAPKQKKALLLCCSKLWEHPVPMVRNCLRLATQD